MFLNLFRLFLIIASQAGTIVEQQYVETDRKGKEKKRRKKKKRLEQQQQLIENANDRRSLQD